MTRENQSEIQEYQLGFLNDHRIAGTFASPVRLGHTQISETRSPTYLGDTVSNQYQFSQREENRAEEREGERERERERVARVAERGKRYK